MSTMGSRIRERRTELGLTQKDVALAVNRSIGAVTQWEGDMTKPNGQNLMKLTKVLNCRAEWLLTGKGDHSNHLLSGITPKGSVLAVYDWNIYPYVEDCPLHAPINPPKEFIVTSAAIGNGAFALRVMDDETISMPKLRIPQGALLTVDNDYPELNDIIGKLLIIRYKKVNILSIKKLAFDGVDYLLQPTNPAFSTIKMSNDVIIVGIIKEITINP
ncbi:helix-turn-helix domain-containing protein [Salmonella enterica]|nr:helix-turn-helix domain-containing protein [Salmonella enterica]